MVELIKENIKLTKMLTNRNLETYASEEFPIPSDLFQQRSVMNVEVFQRKDTGNSQTIKRTGTGTTNFVFSRSATIKSRKSTTRRSDFHGKSILYYNLKSHEHYFSTEELQRAHKNPASFMQIVILIEDNLTNYTDIDFVQRDKARFYFKTKEIDDIINLRKTVITVPLFQKRISKHLFINDEEIMINKLALEESNISQILSSRYHL